MQQTVHQHQQLLLPPTDDALSASQDSVAPNASFHKKIPSSKQANEGRESKDAFTARGQQIG